SYIVLSLVPLRPRTPLVPSTTLFRSMSPTPWNTTAFMPYPPESWRWGQQALSVCYEFRLEARGLVQLFHAPAATAGQSARSAETRFQRHAARRRAVPADWCPAGTA